MFVPSLRLTVTVIAAPEVFDTIRWLMTAPVLAGTTYDPMVVRLPGTFFVAFMPITVAVCITNYFQWRDAARPVDRRPGIERVAS